MSSSLEKVETKIPGFLIRVATQKDIPLIYSFIRELAEYEKLLHEAVATEEQLEKSLFGERPFAEVLIGDLDGVPVAFSLFFYSYSTFLGQPGLYLEDLYVKPEFRGRGLGKVMMAYLAKITTDRGCGRFEWSVLDWNEPAIRVYRQIGAEPLDEWTRQRLTGDALNSLAKQF